MSYEKNFKFAIFATTLIVASSSYSQELMTYIVRSGESLSEILYSSQLRPIYGEGNFLKQTIELNPELKKSKGHFILPGQELVLPVEKLADSGPVSTEAEKENQPEPQSNLENVRTPSEDFSDRASASLSASLGVDFFSVKGVDKTTNDSSLILSEASPSVGLGFNLLWNELTTLSLSSRIQSFKLQPLNNGQTFNDDDGKRVSFSVQALRKLSNSWFIGTGITFEEDLFFFASAADELTVDKVLITKPHLLARYKVFEKNNASIGLDGKLGMNLSNKTDAYSIESGLHAGAGLYFNYHSLDLEKNNKSLEARVFYSTDKQDTSVTTREFNNLSFAVIYDWRLPW